MNEQQQQIDKLKKIIANAPDDVVRQLAQDSLDKLEKRQKITVDKDFSGVLNALDELIRKVYNSSGVMSVEDIDKALSERLKRLKINPNNLSDELKKLIGETKTIAIQINNVVASTAKGLQTRRLVDVILSDFEAQNNVYLYGESGTGKTYICGVIADLINYKLITLNCNQFTAPLDIIGGQTIDGYKEGRLTTAWGNLNLGFNLGCKEYDGALLLIDEMPKLDPNTAGILNDALAKMKDGVKEAVDCDGKTVYKAPSIMNGNGENIEKKNIFIIATGNSLLNEANKDYEANFKQDLSLQDRFVGSCYRIMYNYKFEYEKLMTNLTTKSLPNVTIDLTFAFNFLAQLRMKIVELELTGTAFVSSRLMIVARDTFISYIYNREQKPNNIEDPKTIAEVVKSFMGLFKSDQRENIERDLADEFAEFYKQCEIKQAMPLSELGTSTKEERELAEQIVEKAEVDYKKNSAIPL